MSNRTYTLSTYADGWLIFYQLKYKGATIWTSNPTTSHPEGMSAILDAYKWALADGATHVKHSETGKVNKLQ